MLAESTSIQNTCQCAGICFRQPGCRVVSEPWRWIFDLHEQAGGAVGPRIFSKILSRFKPTIHISLKTVACLFLHSAQKAMVKKKNLLC